MATMEKGFYMLTPNVYYGEYPKEQVSGDWGEIGRWKKEWIKTDVPYEGEESIITLYDNHALTEQELLDLQQSLDIIGTILGAKPQVQIDFEAVETHLGITLPQEIKILYRMLYRMEGMLEGTERFLTLEELYIEEDNLIFYKVKRTPVAISLTEGYLMSYYKKEWFYSPGDVSFLCYVLSRIVVKAILDMPYMKQGRVKGELVKVLSPKEPLSKLYAGKLEILEEYRNYGNIILYNSAGAFGWFRQNGFYADIMIGSLSEELLEEILTVELNVAWKEDKK